MESIWATLNSPVAIAIIAAGLGWLLKWAWTKKPEWQKYEGWVIEAVKWAEKFTSDGSKLDTALDYFLMIYAARTGQTFPESEKAALQNSLDLTHAELEKNAQL